ncbi:MAG: carboxypeptidase-like regulatory domain-containing protein [Longimicrobiales bacterium]
MTQSRAVFGNPQSGPRLRILAVGLLIAVPGLASGQTVTGRVVDDSTDSGIPGVALALVDTAGVPIARAFSNETGWFELRAEQGGILRIRAERMGYATTASAAFRAGPTDVVQVELRLATEPVELPALTVIAHSRPHDLRLANWGFYERRERYRGLGRAVFYDAEELNESNAVRITDLIRNLPDLRLVHEGHRIIIRDRRGRRTIPVFLDGHPLRMTRGESLSIDDYVALSSIGAIEIYWRWAPAQYGGGAAIVLWTGRFE